MTELEVRATLSELEQQRDMLGNRAAALAGKVAKLEEDNRLLRLELNAKDNDGQRPNTD